MQHEPQIIKLDMKIPAPIIVGIGGAGCNVIEELLHSGYEPSRLLYMNARSALVARNWRALGLATIPLLDNVHSETIAEINWAMLVNACPEVLNFHPPQCLVIVAGFGGDTGTTYAPVIARWASRRGMLSMVLVTMPATVEGAARTLNATRGLERLNAVTEHVRVLNMDDIIAYIGKNQLVSEVMRTANEQLRSDVQQLSLN